MIIFQTWAEVRYYETDLMGIVHHSNYIRYFEYGRHKLLQDLNIPVSEIEAAGIMMPVVSVTCRYKAPAKMGDTLRIVTIIDKMPAAKIVARTEIYNGDLLLCNGEVTVGFIHADTRKPTRAPEMLLEKMRPYFCENNLKN